MLVKHRHQLYDSIYFPSTEFKPWSTVINRMIVFIFLRRSLNPDPLSSLTLLTLNSIQLSYPLLHVNWTKVIFRCDKNGDGRLSEEEVKEVSIWDHEIVLLYLFSYWSDCIYCKCCVGVVSVSDTNTCRTFEHAFLIKCRVSVLYSFFQFCETEF
jgi:hypothetical protein